MRKRSRASLKGRLALAAMWLLLAVVICGYTSKVTGEFAWWPFVLAALASVTEVIDR